MHSTNRPGRVLLPPLLALLALLPSACVDESVVFEDRDLLGGIPTAALGFLGYSQEEERRTVCGNCHVGQQAQWENTGHAHAWVTLEGSGHSQEFCEACHSVNQLGNPVTVAAGYLAVEDPRYLDVQCESCHGPGLEHVQNPDAVQPLAPVSVGADLTEGCGECHTGVHHPFVEEWELSGHGSYVASAAGRAECAGCHEGKAALAQFGVNADYVEKGSAEALPIVCAVCHDPHAANFEGQLRFPILEPNAEDHLCARCHDRRTSPEASAHGLHPHAPETALLSGDAGWFPPGSDIDQGQIVATHGSEANPGLCATCHVNAFEVVDDITGDFVFASTGHLFTAIPCLDEQGVPTPGDCALSTSARSFDGCTASGCHGTEEAALSALRTVTLRLESLAEELHGLLLQVDPNLDAAGGEIDGAAQPFTVAEGAFFNYELAVFGGEGRPDDLLTFAAAATHNPFLVESLLRGSIREVRREYGLGTAVHGGG